MSVTGHQGWRPWDGWALGLMQQNHPFQSKAELRFLPHINVKLPRPIDSKIMLFLTIGIILLFSAFCDFGSFPVY